MLVAKFFSSLWSAPTSSQIRWKFNSWSVSQDEELGQDEKEFASLSPSAASRRVLCKSFKPIGHRIARPLHPGKPQQYSINWWRRRDWRIIWSFVIATSAVPWRSEICKFFNTRRAEPTITRKQGIVSYGQFHPSVSKTPILGLCVKSQGQWSTSRSLPGPESTLEAPISQDTKGWFWRSWKPKSVNLSLILD